MFSIPYLQKLHFPIPIPKFLIINLCHKFLCSGFPVAPSDCFYSFFQWSITVFRQCLLSKQIMSLFLETIQLKITWPCPLSLKLFTFILVWVKEFYYKLLNRVHSKTDNNKMIHIFFTLTDQICNHESFPIETFFFSVGKNNEYNTYIIHQFNLWITHRQNRGPGGSMC